MDKRVLHTAFVFFIGFPQLLFASPAIPALANMANRREAGEYCTKISNPHLTTSGITTSNFAFNPQPITICSGAPIVIQGDIENPTPNSYTWELLQGSTWAGAPGTNNAADYQPSLLVNSTSSNIIYDIRRKTITAGVVSYDSFYDVTVLSSAVLTNNTITAPNTTNFCATASPDVIKGSAVSGVGGSFSYQWQSSTDNVNFTDIGGANATDYKPTATTVTSYYRRVATGSCTAPLVSNTVTISIVLGVSNNLIAVPAVSSFCTGGDPALIGGATPTGGNGNYTYQWQMSTDSVNFTDISGATAKDYDPKPISITTYYRRWTTSGICSVPFYSNVVTVAVLSVVNNNTISAPAISTFCMAGSPATLSGNKPTGGNSVYLYQWQISTDNITFTDIAGATAKDYTPGAVTTTTYYRRTVISGSCTTPLISNVVTITIVPLPATPTFSQTVLTQCPGSVITLTVNNAQAGITYNWYDSAAQNNLVYTGISCTTPPITANITLYVEATNGFCSSAATTVVQVNVSVPPQTPVLVADTVTTCSGTSATLTLINPQPGFTYNWYMSATGGSPVFTGTTFITPALSTNTTYYVEANNTTGCNSPGRTAAVVKIPAANPITTQDASVCPGSGASLTAATADPNTTINWYAAATGGSPIFTGNTFTTPVLNNDISYYVSATNNVTGCVSATRQLVQVHMLQPLLAPVVSIDAATNTSITFAWTSVAGATGYKVSTDNGITYTSPSSGNAGLTHTISGLQANQTITIIVMASGASNCQLSALSTAITAKAASLTDDIYVPNAFTPNGDGKNDMVRVRSEGIQTLRFSVYDQWGELLYSTTNALDGWDGTYKGSKEPVGVYVYYLTALMNNGHQVSKKGTITLLR